mgnify:FL=1
MTKMMQAVEITAPGGPDVLQLTERPVPEPSPNEVVIRVARGVSLSGCNDTIVSTDASAAVS